MAAPQGQAISLLLCLFRHLSRLILQHTEAFQLPVLAVCQLVRVGEEVDMSAKGAVTTLTVTSVTKLEPDYDRDPLPGPERVDFGAQHCPNPYSYINGPEKLHPTHFSEGTTKAQKGQYAQGHIAGGRAELGPTPQESTPLGLILMSLGDFEIPEQRKAQIWEWRAEVPGLGGGGAGWRRRVALEHHQIRSLSPRTLKPGLGRHKV